MNEVKQIQENLYQFSSEESLLKDAEKYFLQSENIVLRQKYDEAEDKEELANKITELLIQLTSTFNNLIKERTAFVNVFKKQFGRVILDQGVEGFVGDVLKATEGENLDLSSVEQMKGEFEARLMDSMDADEVEVTISHVQVIPKESRCGSSVLDHLNRAEEQRIL